MNWRLTANGVTRDGYAEGSVAWRCPALRQFGEASLYIPRGSALWDTSVLDDERGILVELQDADLGAWRGFGWPDVTAAGATVAARELGALMESRVVNRSRTFRNLTAGAIARSAVQDALAGLGAPVLAAGTFVEAAPVIPEFRFNGQTLAEVLGDLMADTGQEWAVDGARLNWRPASGSLVALALCEDGDVCGVAREVSDTPVVEVLARGSDGRVVTRAALDASAGSLWRRQAVVDVQTTSDAALAVAADRELRRLRNPQVQYRVALHRRHWSAVREGDYARLVLPTATLRGDCPLVRVVERAYSSGGAYVDLTCSLVRPFRLTDPASAAGLGVEPAVAVAYRDDAARRLVQLERDAAQQRRAG